MLVRHVTEGIDLKVYLKKISYTVLQFMSLKIVKKKVLESRIIRAYI